MILSKLLRLVSILIVGYFVFVTTIFVENFLFPNLDVASGYGALTLAGFIAVVVIVIFAFKWDDASKRKKR